MNILIEKNTLVPMRDGVNLATDVYRPAEDRAFPVIVQRLPYNKDLFATTSFLDTFRVVQAGYVMVLQDTRGQFAADAKPSLLHRKYAIHSSRQIVKNSHSYTLATNPA